MYSRDATESADERFARRLQDEDQQRLTANQLTAAANHTVDTSNMSVQERDDMMLARQMAQIDSYTAGMDPNNNNSNNQQQQQQRNQQAGGNAEPPGAYGSGSYNNNSNSVDNGGGGQMMREGSGGSSGMGGSGRSHSSGMGGSSRRRRDSGGGGEGGAGGENVMEDRLAYARRLQEEAFSRMQPTARPPPQPPKGSAKSREESDHEMAMKMQIEEGDHTTTDVDQEDEDMKLAMFMQQGGVSIRVLDDDGLAALKDDESESSGGGGLRVPTHPPLQNTGGLSSLGLGLGGGAGGGGGMLGGMYGGRRDDDDDESEDEDSIGLHSGHGRPTSAFPSVPPAAATATTTTTVANRPNQIPSTMSPSSAATATNAARKPVPAPQSGGHSSIPPVNTTPLGSNNRKSALKQAPQSSGIPSGIPSVASASAVPDPGSAPAATISTAIPLVSSTRRKIIADSDTPQPPSRILGSRKPFQRQTPKASKSSGSLARMLPNISRSFSSKDRNAAQQSPTRSPPPKSRSAHNNMLGMARGGTRNNSPKSSRRSVSPSPRRHRRNQSNDGAALLGDLPPGVNLSDANAFGGGFDDSEGADDPNLLLPAKKEKKKNMFKRMFGGAKHSSDAKANVPLHGIPGAIPPAGPGPSVAPTGEAGPLPHSRSVNRNIAQGALQNSVAQQEKKTTLVCSVCQGRSGKFLMAMDKKIHLDCFRCMSCNDVIDPTSVFAVSVDPMGEQQPLHRKCYAEFYGTQCAVCKKAIPANEDGSVSFIKHPFFSTEQMCPCHADEVGRRRCTGCHRFEPEDEPFADLNDGGRCVCYSCCRTVIINNEDVKPLWEEVLRFFQFALGIPIWEEMKEIPILVVDQAALNESQMQDGTSAHGDSSQIMTRGLCLSEHEGSMSFRVPSQRFNESINLFESCNHSGFTDFDVGTLKNGNTSSEVMAILCLSGLPRDLTSSVLAHEATHAWIKLHPDFKIRKALPAQVEEGCAQLVAYLFLSEGMSANPMRGSIGRGPTDEKLRQYFKFSIETDDNDIYGEGYRRAAAAYSSIGIVALLNHVVHYQAFPDC